MTDLPCRDLVHVNLPRGRDAAVSIGSLAESLNLTRRQVEKAVETLRTEGVSICTGRKGVWLTDSAAELLANYRALRRRAIHQLWNLRRMQRTAALMKPHEQTLMWIELAS